MRVARECVMSTVCCVQQPRIRAKWSTWTRSQSFRLQGSISRNRENAKGVVGGDAEIGNTAAQVLRSLVR